MQVKLKKYFKYFLFIPLLVFCFAFKISKVNALVYKGIQSSNFTQNTYSGSLNNQEVGFALTFNNDIVNDNNYDIVGIKFLQLNFGIDNGFSLDNPGYYNNNGGYSFRCNSSSSNGYFCVDGDLYQIPPSSVRQNLLGDYIDYNVSFRAHSTNTNGKSIPCYFSNEMENVLLCPIENNIHKISFYISSKTKVYYSFTLDNSKYWLNYESSEMTIQQTQTNTNLQYIYQQQTQTQQYMQNDSVNGSATAFQSGIADLTNSFNSQLAGVNDLTQIVLLPISLFMDLSTDNCIPLHLQIPYVNMSVDLPCMKTIYTQYFGAFFTIFGSIMAGVYCYWVAIKTGSLIKDIVDCDNDRIEVVDL